MKTEKTLEEEIKKYESNINSAGSGINSIFTCISCAMDGMFFMGNFAALGGKAFLYMVKIPAEISNLTDYVKKSGDKGAIKKFALQKAISFIPGLSWYDSGVPGLIKKRIKEQQKTYDAVKPIIQEAKPEDYSSLAPCYAKVPELVK